MSKSVHEIERLRQWRTWPDRSEHVQVRVLALSRHIERTAKRLSAVIGAWEQVVPEDLACHTRIRGFRTGALSAIVESSAMLYELDRFLREGGLELLTHASEGAIVRVRMAIGPLHDPDLEGE